MSGYHNPLAGSDDVADWVLEGDGAVTFPLGRMRLESTRDPAQGQAANVVYWCPVEAPDGVAISWDFWPVHEPGLCILFFAATGHDGRDLFDPRLPARTGEYEQYHHGSLDAYHVSYFRRRWEDERALHTCNLRKSHGFHLVASGADPLPDVADARGPYRIRLTIAAGAVTFSINDVESFRWVDDGSVGGPPLGPGRIGFRQMAPMVAEYANLSIEPL
ncbi:DUF1961 domain-containing protein [Occultella aeris]|uniref:DUF1961 domain-containing protein n=1 Tax=Occultella aeris TaxID=2761496 RepID=A0A7M4DG54_9MICO|nr:DUF1961 family protein [Occultella aeris]VZO35897.1 hypothetical protein HALOF300_01100 [Occultella aeris]